MSDSPASYVHLSGAGTTVVTSGAGTLVRVDVNTGVASATITLYDNTAASGRIIAVISAAAPEQFEYDVAFDNGLTVVIVGTIDVTLVVGV